MWGEGGGGGLFFFVVEEFSWKRKRKIIHLSSDLIGKLESPTFDSIIVSWYI